MSFFQNTAFLLSAVAPVPTGSAAAPSDATPAIPWYLSPGLINTLIIVGLVVVSALVGKWLAKVMRAGDYATKFSVIFFAAAASGVVVWLGWPPRLGVDLGGGSILVYKVDVTQTQWRADRQDSLIKSISERVNPGGQKEITVKGLGTNMVEIIIPKVYGANEKERQAEAEHIRSTIRRTGALEFRIVPSPSFQSESSLIDQARQSLTDLKEKMERDGVTHPAEAFKTLSLTYPLDAPAGTEKAKWVRVRDKEVSKVIYIRDQSGHSSPNPAAMNVGKDDKGKDVWEVLVLAPESENYNVTGGDVRDAQEGRDENGNPEVRFSFNTAGGMKFGRFTAEYVPNGDKYHDLAIVLDNILQTAPRLQSAIQDSGVITGNFTPQEVKEIVDIINAGSLPAALYPTPVRDMTTDATLGKETIQQSMWAMLIAAIVVPAFMIYYYRFAGLVAVLALALNMLMLVAVMILFKAPFTLPALAGLALTVGMDVDNNVLIYERLREELAHGAALRMAIRNAFHRVGVVIIDANITHIIAAIVLYAVGTEQIKGFAVTFLLGAVLSIWATMFVARIMFEVCERRRWLTRLKMMQWIGHTKIDFMAWFPFWATFSVVITVLGLAVSGIRGRGLLDIDFTGGISVQMAFQKPHEIKEIREKTSVKGLATIFPELSEKERENLLPDLTVSNAHQADEPVNERFTINTSRSSEKPEETEKIKKEVEGLLTRIFEKDNLVFMGLEYQKISAGGDARWPDERPAEPPVDRSPKPAETKPAESKSTGTKPASEKLPSPSGRGAGGEGSLQPQPTGTKPAENEPRQPRLDLPPLSLVAMPGDEAVLLAQADTIPAKTSAVPAMTSAIPAKTSAVPPMTSVTPAKTSAISAKTETKPETTLPGQVPAEGLPEPAAAPAVSPSSPVFQAKLSLSSTVSKLRMEDEKLVPKDVREKVDYDKDRLRELVKQALIDNQIDEKSVAIDLIPADDPKKTSSDRWTVKLTPSSDAANVLTEPKFDAVLKTLQANVAKLPYFPIEDNVGADVRNENCLWAVVALVVSWSLIILYLWIRFQGVAFGLAAVIALIHDVLVMLGAIAFSSYLAQIPGVTACLGIEPFKINLQLVAAFLTIIGYSVNDTIVVFDRIREIRGKSPTLTRQMVNDATNQTLSRTVLTSFTVMLVVLILYIFGGPAVHGFAFALIIGVLTGTYSSIYVAAPILLWLLHPKEMRASAVPSDK